MVEVNMSRQMGQVNSLCKLRADTAISVSSVMASLNHNKKGEIVSHLAYVLMECQNPNRDFDVSGL